MSYQIGINGFGRIGRMVARVASKDPNVKIAAINDPFLTADYAKYLLQYDTVHNRFDGTVEVDGSDLIINGERCVMSQEKDPKDIKWGSKGAEYIVESTGVFKELDTASLHIDAGAKKVVISAPSSTAPMFVMGCNDELVDPSMNIVSNASCTTNCLSPVAKVLHDTWGIESGLLNTIHAVTGSQAVVDGFGGKDWRGGRASHNIIPSSTGAAKAVGSIIPSLNGKLTGMATRVPVLNVSMVDLTVNLKSDATYEEICAKMKEASETSLKGVLGYTEEPIVSSDFIGDTRTSIFDQSAGIALTPRFVKVVSWYDNEMGYSAKLIDLLKKVAGQ